MTPIYKSKTFWVAISGICTAAGAYFEGSIGLPGLISAVFGAAGLIFMRMGVSKSGIPDMKDRGEEIK